jgi:hypothetical protein
VTVGAPQSFVVITPTKGGAIFSHIIAVKSSFEVMRVRVFVVLYRQADKNYASNLNDKLYAVPKIEDMEYPAYLLGYAYGGSPPCLLVCLSVYVGVGVGVDVLPRARQ